MKYVTLTTTYQGLKGPKGHENAGPGKRKYSGTMYPMQANMATYQNDIVVLVLIPGTCTFLENGFGC